MHSLLMLSLLLFGMLALSRLTKKASPLFKLQYALPYNKYYYQRRPWLRFLVK